MKNVYSMSAYQTVTRIELVVTACKDVSDAGSFSFSLTVLNSCVESSFKIILVPKLRSVSADFQKNEQDGILKFEFLRQEILCFPLKEPGIFSYHLPEKWQMSKQRCFTLDLLNSRLNSLNRAHCFISIMISTWIFIKRYSYLVLM